VLESGAATHVGLVRSQNQDSILMLPEEGLFAVADGMGGLSGGGVASRIAVESIRDQAAPGMDWPRAMAAADRAVSEAASVGMDGPGMGTTLVALQVEGNRWRVAWVGDSRAYRIAAGIERLTRDHSFVQELVDSGILAEDEARDHPQRNIITRALGDIDGDAGLVGVREGRLSPGETFLLCTDGLHGLLGDEEIRRIAVSAGSPQEMADALVQAALNAGGTDNVTVIAVRASD
jgi:serine/threonine protein phosphatase PrpC